MMNRVRRTARHKSPSPDSEDSMDFKKSSVGSRRAVGSNYSSMLGGSSSPILSHKTSTTSGSGFGPVGLGATYTIGVYKSTQVCSYINCFTNNGCILILDLFMYVH